MATPNALTTHVLDTARGVPAAGMRVDLYRWDGGEREWIESFVTNDDGRTDRPVLSGDALSSGFYELVFHVGGYFASTGLDDGGLPFLDMVPVRFGVADPAAGHHVPLLVAPYGYSTYRGS